MSIWTLSTSCMPKQTKCICFSVQSSSSQYDVYDIDLPSTSPLFIIPKYVLPMIWYLFCIDLFSLAVLFPLPVSIYGFLHWDCRHDCVFIPPFHSIRSHFPYSILSRYLYPVVYYYRDLNTVNKMNCQLSWDLTLQTYFPFSTTRFLESVQSVSTTLMINSSSTTPTKRSTIALFLILLLKTVFHAAHSPNHWIGEIMKLYRSLQSQYNGIYSLALYVWKSSEHANEFKSYFIEDAENQYIKVFNLFKKEQISIAQKELEQWLSQPFLSCSPLYANEQVYTQK